MPHPLQVKVHSPEELSVYSKNNDVTEQKVSCNRFQNTRTRQKERGILCWRLLLQTKYWERRKQSKQRFEDVYDGYCYSHGLPSQERRLPYFVLVRQLFMTKVAITHVKGSSLRSPMFATVTGFNLSSRRRLLSFLHSPKY